jgi:hypothetical protein
MQFLLMPDPQIPHIFFWIPGTVQQAFRNVQFAPDFGLMRDMRDMLIVRSSARRESGNTQVILLPLILSDFEIRVRITCEEEVVRGVDIDPSIPQIDVELRLIHALLVDRVAITVAGIAKAISQSINHTRLLVLHSYWCAWLSLLQ